MNWQGPLTLLALGALAGLTWWLLKVATPLAASSATPSTLPDYYFTGPRIVRYDPAGRVQLDLTAARATHYPHDDSIALESLAVAWRTTEGAVWRMAAARGTTPADGSRITLEGEVEVTRPGPDGGAGLAMRTEHVVLDTAARRLEARGAIDLRDGAVHVTAIGLSADLANDRIQLAQRVRGSYAAR